MMLEVDNLSRTFGGLRALKDVTFHLAEGEILGLIGPNGAGKTTLFNCINGVYPPTGGTVTLSRPEPQRAAYLQGGAPGHGAHAPDRAPAQRADRARKRDGGRLLRSPPPQQEGGGAHRRRVLDQVGLAPRADQLANSLNVAQKKRLELARALAAEPYLLLLDEVLAGLNPSEVSAMLEVIRQVRDRGSRSS